MKIRLAFALATLALTACQADSTTSTEPDTGEPSATASPSPSHTASEEPTASVAPCELASLEAVTAAVNAHIDPDPKVRLSYDDESLCMFTIDQASDTNMGYVWEEGGITSLTLEVRTGRNAISLKERAPQGERLPESTADVEVTWTVCPAGQCNDNSFAEAVLFVDGGDGQVAAIVFEPFGPEEAARAIAIDIAQATREAFS